MKYIQCKTCNRIIQEDHADEYGNCCFCEHPEPQKNTGPSSVLEKPKRETEKDKAKGKSAVPHEAH